ncbi:dihydroorotate dehydrogenase-like protein [Rhodopirellula europaea]|uniref:Dihydroorotate dehydrogenase 2 n=1 Tax=Rhodopirellula europaea 6C TaxID=1263867 RepID=M2B9L3_9BACT|nr:dihydroorotate dehydrogenase-like protein [Rhodopirellula europaea]EMB18383.1 dihydroorotate dehydrogenase 2 [Rhodopirellula europaea 6C]
MTSRLNTQFGGLSLRSPVIVGASPLSMNERTRLAMEEAGAGAIVLPSLFEEQVIDWSWNHGRQLTPKERSILGQSDRTKHHWVCPDGDSYLALVNRASSLQDIPIIASLNGYTAGGWMDFAGELEEAGASAIELNVHHSGAREDGSSTEIETMILDSIRDVNSAITVPLFVKLSSNFTSLPHLARQLLSGAQGMVLHGRAPKVDICLDTLRLASRWRISSAEEGIDSLDTLMQVHSCCPAMPLAACGGVGTADHLIKVLLAGADAAMVTSAIYREGASVIQTMLQGLVSFMEKRDMQSLQDLKLRRPLEFSSDEERTAYIAALTAHLRKEDPSSTETEAVRREAFGI